MSAFVLTLHKSPNPCALRRAKEKDHKVGASLSYIGRFCLKNKNRQKSGKKSRQWLRWYNKQTSEPLEEPVTTLLVESHLQGLGDSPRLYISSKLPGESDNPNLISHLEPLCVCVHTHACFTHEKHTTTELHSQFKKSHCLNIPNYSLQEDNQPLPVRSSNTKSINWAKITSQNLHRHFSLHCLILNE